MTISTSPELRYQVIHRNGSVSNVAEFIRQENGEFIFRYIPDNNIEFPSFPFTKGEYISPTLWESIVFRIPKTLQNQYPGRPPEELLEFTQGKLVTDHFEFKKQ